LKVERKRFGIYTEGTESTEDTEKSGEKITQRRRVNRVSAEKRREEKRREEKRREKQIPRYARNDNSWSGRVGAGGEQI
jgi:hypothetical protein